MSDCSQRCKWEGRGIPWTIADLRDDMGAFMSICAKELDADFKFIFMCICMLL